ncbi:hypothetical protein V5799_030026 [Amblyomma americanum]|uniref:Peptidase M13 N-terminal domain-containing protein n=1 Tax=Amblyomma americanum TaxID=6943 RepID=A0AAQ4EPF9_AMBAM
MNPYTEKPKNQPRTSAVNAQTETLAKEQPEDPKDDENTSALTSQQKPSRRQRKRGHFPRKPDRSNDVKAGTTELSKTPGSERRKSKVPIGTSSSEGTIEEKPSLTPHLLSPPQGDEATKMPEGSTAVQQRCLKDIASDKQERQNADKEERVEVQDLMASATATNAPQAEEDEGVKAELKEPIETSNTTLKTNANSDQAAGTKESSNKGNADTEIKTGTKAEVSTNEIDGGIVEKLEKNEGTKSVSAVKVVSPQANILGQTGNDASAAPNSATCGEKTRRSGRSLRRRSFIDARFARSISALRDLANSLRTDSAMRVQAASRTSMTLHNLQIRVVLTVSIAVFIVVALTLLFWVAVGPRYSERGVCTSAACAELSDVFKGTLNYSVDPCVDLDAFVCSKGLRRGEGGWPGSRTIVTHLIKEYQLDMVHLFLDGKTEFAASRVVSDFLRECTGSDEAQPSVDTFKDLFELMPLPWPFDPSDVKHVHPLEAVLTLSLKWGIDTWFRAYVHTVNRNGLPALFIQASRPI